MMTRPDLFAQV